MIILNRQKQGVIVEKLEFKYNFLGLHFCKVWKPYITSAGLDCCWHHSSKYWAICNLVRKVQEETGGVWFEDYLAFNPSKYNI